MKGIFFLLFIPFLVLSQSNDVLKIRGKKPIELLNNDIIENVNLSFLIRENNYFFQ